ncbi:hypothetical protein ACFL55_03320 [Candidatus Latescibacterota bacterium]
MRREVIEDVRALGEAALPHLWKDELGDVFVLTRHTAATNEKTAGASGLLIPFTQSINPSWEAINGYYNKNQRIVKQEKSY